MHSVMATIETGSAGNAEDGLQGQRLHSVAVTMMGIDSLPQLSHMVVSTCSLLSLLLFQLSSVSNP